MNPLTVYFQAELRRFRRRIWWRETGIPLCGAGLASFLAVTAIVLSRMGY